MLQLVYSSTARKPFTNRELFALLQQARDKNRRLGITGLLLYHKGTVMQALEGDEEVVLPLFATICRDQRHHRVSVFLRVTFSQRQFPDWSMGFKTQEVADFGSVEGHKPTVELPEWAKYFLGELSS